MFDTKYQLRHIRWKKNTSSNKTLTMINWCANSIQITGSEIELEEFYETLYTPNVKGEIVPFSFHQTVPIQQGFESEVSKAIVWGTPSDAESVNIISRTPYVFLLSCDTAWNPPLNWTRSFVRRFPSLQVRIAYVDGGIQFYGIILARYNRITLTEYPFSYGDLQHIVYDPETGRERLAEEDEYPDEIRPAGMLEQFMNHYQVAHI
jgi:hypothetical protein